ncbi:cell division ATP-binding protein FtsE [Emticicia sp. 21SJ11W-3]|uniref:cell division ATP-binding protein FtsE n=1 Tax=Emticicia sp. 21SJ11W-3 TaxID=2916755 RepID=UPI0020A17510|nr:ATP-binding cassette domain-containing protein [Emticicia sp. 21SJ11W-3]UTA69514.1 ATP-binding cassette domain-containing protein [Emticicia sp. 21SJ11W-3]
MEPVISLRNAYIYQREQLVLSSVNFTIHQGEFVFLIGRTGSGKSSVLKTLYADLWLEKGTGIVAGYDLHTIKRAQVPYLRRNIGIVFQDFQLLSDRNIEKNLVFYLRAMGWEDKNEMRNRIDEALKLVNLQNILTKMPHQLSGGEQQRVGIARALLNHPQILLADEPTGNLDPEMSVEILKLFKDINEKSKTAVLMATHNFELIERFPSRTLYCDKGLITDLSDGL